MKHFFLLATIIMISAVSRAQSCGSCTVNITGVDSASYVITSGQVLCIDTTGYFTGTVTVNGGTLCNKGFFKPKVLNFSGGTIVNKSNVLIKSNVSLGTGKTIVNEAGAILRVKGSLTIEGGTFSNGGISNIQLGVSRTSGSLTNTGIINCATVSGSGITNSGVINSNQ